MPTALITGITGQDGSYLAELLLEKGYKVVGLVRRTSTVNFERIGHIQDRIVFASADMLDQTSLIRVIEEHRPDEVYNLAAQSFVQTSWQQPVFTGEVTALGVTRLLSGLARLVQHPGQHRMDAVHLGWVGSTLLALVHFWWWQFGLYLIEAWTFGTYLFVIGYAIGQSYDGTLVPFAIGSLGGTVLALAIVLAVEKGRLFAPYNRRS